MKKVFSLLLAIAMLLACVPASLAESTLAPAHVRLYFVSDPPTTIDAVEAKLNEILQRDMNTTISLEFSTWTDFMQKYEMELMSGDCPDLVYSAKWLNHAQYANNGAFIDLTDAIAQYAPTLYSLYPENTWKSVSVNGKVYGIPCIYRISNTKGLQYRQDLCDKYGLPVPDSIENIEKYLLGVKENEPDMKLWEGTIFGSSTAEMFAPFLALLSMRYNLVNLDGSNYGLVFEYDAPDVPIQYWGSAEFIEDLKTVKRWRELGFWSKSILSETTDPASYDYGFYAMNSAGQTTWKVNNTRLMQAEIDPSFDSQYWYFANIHKNAWWATKMTNMTVIPYGCKQVDRALMVLEKIMTDEECYRLIQFGVEGEDYTIDAEGNYHQINNPDGTPRYGNSPFGWNLYNEPMEPGFPENAWMYAKFDELETFVAQTPFDAVDIYGNFNENSNDYLAERTALANVCTQYLAPLEAGLVDDIEAGVAEFMQKANEAGLQKIWEAYTQQWLDYCQANGYTTK